MKQRQMRKLNDCMRISLFVNNLLSTYIINENDAFVYHIQSKKGLDEYIKGNKDQKILMYVPK
jgi:hypothetical protein